jgi:hypothetical protein
MAIIGNAERFDKGGSLTNAMKEFVRHLVKNLVGWPRRIQIEEWKLFALEVQMSEEDLEVLITLDDPGEDTLEEDTFHLQADHTTARRSGQPQQGGDPTSKQK